MATVLGANTLSTGSFDVANSVRMNRGSTEHLRRTNNTGETSNKIGTYSGWVKRSTIALDGMMFEGKDLDANNYTQIYFQATGKLTVYGSGSSDIVSTALFKDPTAWYHVCVAIDTTQGTAANRVKIYVNGVQLTSLTNGNGDAAEYPDQNDVIYFAVNGDQQAIGIREDGALLWNGYFSEVVYIDGAALAPTSFGEFDEDSGIWKPIKVSGLTAGTNGFLYTFEQTAQLGKDTFSGNANFGTEENFGTINQKTDTCTNNFCIWNVAADNQDVTFGSGACKVVHGTATARRPVISTFGVANGKWYWEWKAAGSPTAANMEVGIVNYASPTSQGRYLGQALTTDADFTTYIGDGNINVSGSASDSGTAYAGGNIIGVAVDVDNEKIYFYKNNTLINSGGTDYSGMTIGSGFIFMSNADRSGSASYTASVNFGQPVVANSSDAADGNGHGRFEYAPPSGFLALCTKNLAETG